MDFAIFFAGMQALAAFLQVWQTEKNSTEASRRYFEAKMQALDNPETKAKAAKLKALIQDHPVLGGLIKNRLGRCEDKFEAALRAEKDEELNQHAKEFVKCKCLIMQAIKTAQSSLSPDLQVEWDKYNCELVLG